MARKGKLKWEFILKELVDRPGGQICAITRYALRDDGVLLKKNQTLNVDGSARYDFGWKVVNRKVPDGAIEMLRKLGFSRVS